MEDKVKTELPSLAEVQAFFCKGMLTGYAMGKKALRDRPYPKWKQAPLFVEGGLMLVDTWLTTKFSRFSQGITTIYYEGNPIWVMSYWGEYDPVAIPTLQAALQWAYENGMFLGGRGPATFEKDGMKYWNQPNQERRDFANFEGHEFILKFEKGQVLGSHQYRGQWCGG